MKKLIIALIAPLMGLSAWAWSQKGHDVTAYIAEQHLTPAAAAAVDSIFHGKSMVYWANWLDNASHTMDYAYTKTWHYKNIDEGYKFDEAPLNEKGDIVGAVNMQIATLSDSTTTPQEAELALRILVHCMGDMHQPMHMGHLSDLGGNKTKLKYFDRETTLHSIWDGSLVESAHKWSYTEWQQQIDRATPEEQLTIIAGTPESWAEETFGVAGKVYKYYQPGLNVKYDQIAYATPIIEQQFLRGGLRLAHVLNSIFDPDYRAASEQ